MNNEKKNLKVHIFGSEYTLKIEDDVDKIYAIADFVDSKMREIQAARPSRPIHQIAILAALNIAMELFNERDSGSTDLEDMKEKIKSLNSKFDLSMKKILESSEQG